MYNFDLLYSSSPSQFDKTVTEDEIDALLDKPSSVMILNNSRWSAVQAIDKTNKDAFLQQLILEEVIVRREANLKAFLCGMRVLGVASLVMDYPFLMKPLMVAGEFTLTSPLFLSLIKGHRPLEPEHSLTYDMFFEFVKTIGGRGS